MFESGKPIIGVIHLPPLPGYPDSPGLSAILDKAAGDLAALEQGGADAALVENEHDRPHRVEAAPETLAVMTRVSHALVASGTHLAIGVEILLNDPEASLAAAHAAGAAFIRTDYFSDPMERPEHGGPMRIAPDELMAFRERIGADPVRIFADVQVKYARLRVERSLEDSARIARSHRADAIVVTGSETGDAPAPAAVHEAKKGAGATPVLIGSGLDASNASALMGLADGAIVGTSLKTGDAIDPIKVRALVDACRLRG